MTRTNNTRSSQLRENNTKEQTTYTFEEPNLPGFLQYTHLDNINNLIASKSNKWDNSILLKWRKPKKRREFITFEGFLGSWGCSWRLCWLILALCWAMLGHLGAILEQLGDKMRPESAKMSQDSAQERQDEAR